MNDTQPIRSGRPNGEWTPRSTIYRGVTMRSRLEASWAESWDNLGFEWQYEPCCFADQTGQYLPDFLLRGLFDGEPAYVEIKPTHRDIDTVQRRMEIILSSIPDAVLVLYVGTPGDQPAFDFRAAVNFWGRGWRHVG